MCGETAYSDISPKIFRFCLRLKIKTRKTNNAELSQNFRLVRKISVGTQRYPLTPEHGFPSLYTKPRALPLGLSHLSENPFLKSKKQESLFVGSPASRKISSYGGITHIRFKGSKVIPSSQPVKTSSPVLIKVLIQLIFILFKKNYQSSSMVETDIVISSRTFSNAPTVSKDVNTFLVLSAAQRRILNPSSAVSLEKSCVFIP